MRTAILATLVSLVAVNLHAQTLPAVSYTVGFFLPGITPTTGAPVQPPVTYPLSAVKCGQAPLPQPPLLVNPNEGRFTDPANSGLDCVVDVSAQVLALPAMPTLRGAWRANTANGSGAWGDLSDPFERRLGPPQPPAHPRFR